jgi:hypothetical protein
MRPLFAMVLLASLVSLTQGAAALTLDTRTPTNADGSTKFVDPDDKVDNLAAPSTNGSASGMKTFRSGNSTFSFGITHGDSRSGFGSAAPFGSFGFNHSQRGFNPD